MTLPIPILDDRSYEQLRDAMLRRVAVYTPEWRPDPSDPGITLLELFAFLGENLLFRFNQIPDQTQLWLLHLLHVRPHPARPALAPAPPPRPALPGAPRARARHVRPDAPHVPPDRDGRARLRGHGRQDPVHRRRGRTRAAARRDGSGQGGGDDARRPGAQGA